ncbi:hypothetical protein BAUCODRAFT_145476 [Baudoinia panamericana UAMH 10762]|uniref:Nucleoporin NUP37 n=1 Tax=Baudoinia panamericana (strain UAMH 10762) TaxID=717646 RepID=M2LZN8_BAUPA|nr:uncharacterized protein BAUCODRAFT_145476 [Baudoinia panamericana UAMH 10762]EMD00168.1 hypothetical protein BAUCODRAFT_145476 [Baudoinia panamericana UAMH 10762]
MEPHVWKRDRKLHLSYEIPHRTTGAQLYPVAAPNGSDVIVYGHDRGVRILWRGGRRRRQTQAAQAAGKAQTNGTRSRKDAVALTADDDDDGQVMFEDEEDEQDPDYPYPRINQEVDIELEAEVLRLALPILPLLALRQQGLLREQAYLAIACSDGSVQVLKLDLIPPLDEGRVDYAETVRSTALTLVADAAVCTDLAAKLSIRKQDTLSSDDPTSIFVVAVSDELRVYSLPLSETSPETIRKPQTVLVPLPHPVVAVSLHPSPTSGLILIADVSGAVRVYEHISERGDLADVTEDLHLTAQTSGGWRTAFMGPYAEAQTGVARRKHILDVQWVLDGKAVLALLEDGRWGLWDFALGTQSHRSPGDFVSHGSLAPTTNLEAGLPIRQSKSTSRLAPMTPSTRKAKAEKLFIGPSKTTGAPGRGGISVSASSNRTGNIDESVVIWYDSEVYTIPNMQGFWQRSSDSGSGGSGSLYAPGLTHIGDVRLRNENITSISQFAPSVTGAGGQMNTPRDLLVAAEHRLIISQSLRSPTPVRSLFAQAAPKRPPVEDQIMLDAGQLDLGGMDRLLDSMAHADPRPRKVGFTH